MKQFLFCSITILSFTSSYSQGLLNKLKNKANQEVSKLEKGTTASSPGALPSKNKLSSNVSRSVVVTLNNDEIFDYGENCIDLGASINQISFIVTKRTGSTTQCYAYKNGSKTTVPCPTGTNSACQASLQCSYAELRDLDMNSDDFKKYVANETESHTLQQPTLTDQQLKTMAAYMTPAQLEEVKKNMAEAQKQTANQTYSTIKSSTITFNTKTYGPYKQIGKFYLTPDGKNFYATVGESKDANSPLVQYKIITSASTNVIAFSDNAMPSSCFASPDNSEFGSVSYSIGGQNFVVTTSSGKKYEVPLSGGGVEKVWYSATGNHVIFLAQNQLYLDGKVIKTFAASTYVKPCDLFVNPDGQSVTLIKDNTISFADGDYFEHPLKISVAMVGTKPYYKWLALENNEVVVYQKPF